MSFLVISVAALLVSGLTLFSGFGLGTLLMPVFALFFPVEMAVAATAVVHMANSVFKVVAVGRQADPGLVARFGVPAILAALVGAALLGRLSGLAPLVTCEIWGHSAVITPLKLVMAGLMFLFALFELLPGWRALSFDRRYLVAGGLLSGFFGGLSGHQGALRAAFLAKVGVSAAAFVGTNAVIGFMVDLARIAGYFAVFVAGRAAIPIRPEQWPLIGVAILAALAGVLIGKRFLRKITMPTVQTVTGLLLFVIALALGIGLV
ncbi:MAG: TSUP family transporter [Thermodesulfobacteriota bacterium]